MNGTYITRQQLMTLLQLKPILDTWQLASWEEFVQLADDKNSDKLKCYYYNRRMRFEPMSTGSDHSNDGALLLFALSFFAAHQEIQMTTKDGCSYRKPGFDEFQPDISCYMGDNADAIPWGTRVVNLEQYPLPDLVIEISDTSLADDLGAKRLQYEALRIPEYWIVDVKAIEILAFSTSTDGTIRRIEASQLLPGLKFEILLEALRRSRQENQSATNAWLMKQFQN
jgi:Uma2 family endonuclease